MSRNVTPEQVARDMLERMGWERAQELSAGDVVELANLIADVWALQRAIPDWRRLAMPLNRLATTHPAPALAGDSVFDALWRMAEP